jgi:hypothetical protein
MAAGGFAGGVCSILVNCPGGAADFAYYAAFFFFEAPLPIFISSLLDLDRATYIQSLVLSSYLKHVST